MFTPTTPPIAANRFRSTDGTGETMIVTDSDYEALTGLPSSAMSFASTITLTDDAGIPSTFEYTGTDYYHAR